MGSGVEPPGADPHAWWCGKGRLEAGPYPIRLHAEVNQQPIRFMRLGGLAEPERKRHVVVLAYVVKSTIRSRRPSRMPQKVRSGRMRGSPNVEIVEILCVRQVAFLLKKKMSWGQARAADFEQGKPTGPRRILIVRADAVNLLNDHQRLASDGGSWEVCRQRDGTHYDLGQEDSKGHGISSVCICNAKLRGARADKSNISKHLFVRPSRMPC